MNIDTTALVRAVAAKLPPELQWEACANMISKQRDEEAVKAEVVRILQSSQGQALLRQVAARNQRQQHAGLITRNGRTIDLARMQAESARLQRETDAVLRRARAERAGYR